MSSLLTTLQQLVHLTKDWHSESGEHTCRAVMTIPDKQVTPSLRPSLTSVVELPAGAETVYTDGPYKVVRTLLQRVRGTAVYQASASKVAQDYDVSYKAYAWILRAGWTQRQRRNWSVQQSRGKFIGIKSLTPNSSFLFRFCLIKYTFKNIHRMH